jgi:hypothetical protein
MKGGREKESGPAAVGIRFCGGCNPWIDRGRIALELREALEGLGCRVAAGGGNEADIVVFLCGCPSGCAFRDHPGNIPSVVVAAATVDFGEVGEERIVPEVLARVERFLENRRKRRPSGD